MIHLRRFNREGLSRFRTVLRNLRDGKDEDIEALLWDEELTEQLSEEPLLEQRSFTNRREAGEYLVEALDGLDLDAVDRDVGLWAWLSAAFFDVVAPKVGKSRAIQKDDARYIPEVDDYQKYYRHLLAGPFQICRAHSGEVDKAMVVLATRVHQPGEAVEQLASRQQIVSNPKFLEAATRLYYDEESGDLKRGHAGKGGGSTRRLAKDIFEQFDLTWDFYGLGAGEIVELLPGEFDRFRD